MHLAPYILSGLGAASLVLAAPPNMIQPRYANQGDPNSISPTPTTTTSQTGNPTAVVGRDEKMPDPHNWNSWHGPHGTGNLPGPTPGPGGWPNHPDKRGGDGKGWSGWGGGGPGQNPHGPHNPFPTGGAPGQHWRKRGLAPTPTPTPTPTSATS